MPRLILASTSPRRAALLREFGYQFEIHAEPVDEIHVDFLSVGEMVLFNAVKKSRAASRLHPSAVVVAADTLVAIDGEALGKPADMAEARQMLRRLSGRVHQVFTGLSLTRKVDNHSEYMIVLTDVWFRELSEEAIDTYLTLIQPLDKAGGYAAQEHGERVIQKIDGSWTNVVGLPMERFQQLFRRYLG